MEPVDRDTTTPFLLKLFYRTGAFHRPDEFSSPNNLPPHISIYTWPSATLFELTHQLAASSPDILPSPAIGTRIAFRLLFHDIRNTARAGPAPEALGAPHRPVVKDLGSVVIGDGGPGISTDLDMAGETEEGRLRAGVTAGSDLESAKTLADARFVVGDYISCAILPPSDVDGTVQPASAARVGRGFGIGQARSTIDLGPPPSRRENGNGRMGSRGVVGPFGSAGVPPVGEWRRGEQLPDGPGRPRGRRRW